MRFFLRNKKRDLSAKSRNGEDVKKVKENSESTGFLSDEVYRDGLNSLECAQILVNYLRNNRKSGKRIIYFKRRNQKRAN